MNPGAEPLIDFALFTAIEIERRAVCKAFRLSDKHRVTKGNRVYWRGQLPLPGGKFYEIVVAQSPDMGNVDAAVMATSMIHDWSPGALLLVGIAGAGSTDQKLGDLVLGRDVYYHERGKETPAGAKLEPYMYRADALLWNHVVALPQWKAKIAAPRPDGKKDRPQIHQGVIASGERVIADIAARDQIAAGHRKIVAIEMEGHGVGAALWQSVDRVRGLVIRAICDLADASKNSQWHSYAAAVAAGFTRHFLLDQPVTPRNPPPASPTKRVQLTVAMDFVTFGAKDERFLIYTLAGFLEISPEAIKICLIEEGSVKLIVELPLDAAERLLKAGESGVVPLKGYSLGEIRVGPDPKAVESYTFATVGSTAKLADLRARAWIEYARALRVSGRILDAEEAFTKAKRFCEEGTGDPPLRASLLHGLASLRNFQRRFDEAIALADEASRIYREINERHSVASMGVLKAIAQIYAGEPGAAVRTLNRSIPLIENENDPHLLLAACHNLIRTYIDLGEPEHALSLYYEARDLYKEIQDPLILLRSGWQEGQLLRDLGHLRAAEAALLAALQGFQERELLHEVALVSLDLSEVYLRLGETEKLREAVVGLVPIFTSLGVDREMLAALLQLQQADQQSRQALELIRFLSSRVELFQSKMVK